MSSFHMENNNDDLCMGLAARWTEEMGDRRPHKEDMDSPAGYVTNVEDGEYIQQYASSGVEEEEYHDAYNSQEYAYPDGQDEAAMEDDGSQQSFGTTFRSNQGDANGVSYTNDDDGGEYLDRTGYDPNRIYEGAGQPFDNNTDTNDHQQFFAQEDQEEAQKIMAYQGVISSYDNGEYNLHHNGDENGPMVDPGIVQEIRVRMDETNQEIRSLTSKLLEAIEGYVHTLVETEEVYTTVQQRELAESERLDGIEVDVRKALSAMKLLGTVTEEEEEEEGSLDDAEEEVARDDEGIQEDYGNEKVYHEDEDIYQDNDCQAAKHQVLQNEKLDTEGGFHGNDGK